MARYVFERFLSYDGGAKQDKGRSISYSFEHAPNGREYRQLYLVLSSYDERRIHDEIKALVGHHVRITVETIS